MSKRKNMSVAQQFALENERSNHFLDKLNQIKETTKVSKQRTIVNQQKLEWFKTFRQDQKREEALFEEIQQFINENQLYQKDEKRKVKAN